MPADTSVSTSTPYPNRVREFRLARGLSRAELSLALDGALSTAALAQIERGQKPLKPRLVLAIAQVLEVIPAIRLVTPPAFTVHLVKRG